MHVAIAILLAFIASSGSSTLLQWTGGDFRHPDGVPKNCICTRFQIHNGTVYLVFPRFKPGVATTLAQTALESSREATLTPFPDWDTQSRLHSIVDLYIDSRNILWVLDVGVINALDNPLRMSPPRIVGYNVTSQSQSNFLDLSGLVVQASRLQYVIADYECDGHPFIYVTDAAARALLVLDVHAGKNYRLVLPKEVTGNRRDVLYAVLVHTNQESLLVFTYLSSQRVFAISTRDLHSGSAMGGVQDLGVKDGKVVFVGADGGASIFYRYEGKPKVYRWDLNQSAHFTRGELVYSSPNGYLVTEVNADIANDRMMVLESNFADYVKGTVGCGVSHRMAVMDYNNDH